MMQINEAKIKWRMRRGMLELDLLFIQFIKNFQHDYSPSVCDRLYRVLELPDPDLYAWLMGFETPHDEQDKEDIDFVKQYLNC